MIKWIVAFLLAAVFPFAGTACTESAPGQAFARQSGSDQSASQAQQPATDSHKPDSGWHHFGEKNSSPSRKPAPSFASGGWHYFGPAEHEIRPVAPPAKSPSAARPAPPAYRVYHPAAPSSAPKTVSRSSGSSIRYASASAADLEREMFDLINRDRRSAGVPPLRWNAQLADVARAHSLDMLRQGYFGHATPGGVSPGERISAAGMDWQAEGENIAIEPTVSHAEADFMNEPRHQQNHRWNILNRGYTEVGVGVVRDSAGRLYITQDFMHAP